MTNTKRFLVAATTVAAGALIAQAPLFEPARIPVGAVGAHVLGRVQFDAERTGELFGYFSFIDGFGPAIYNGDASEKNAHFTYRTNRFQLQLASHGPIVVARPAGSDGEPVLYRIYYNPFPNSDFSRPDSFSQGQVIATYRGRAIQLEAIPLLTARASGTLDLVSSNDFFFRGRSLNLASIANHLTITLTGGPAPAGRSSDPVLTFSYGGVGVAAAAPAN
jgi:hypothetical protein